MNTGILRQFVSLHLEEVLLAVAVLSCVVSVFLWVTLYRRRGTKVSGEMVLPSGVVASETKKKPSVWLLRVASGREGGLLKALMRARRSHPNRPLRVEFSEGAYCLSKPLQLLDHLCFEGISAGLSILRSASGVPALVLERVRDCLVKGFTIQGGVRCSEGDLTLEDCVVQNGESAAGIEAINGATVTFSGTIASRDGGVAIRAVGGSRVILQRPYHIADEDRILLEPGCQIDF